MALGASAREAVDGRRDDVPSDADSICGIAATRCIRIFPAPDTNTAHDEGPAPPGRAVVVRLQGGRSGLSGADTLLDPFAQVVVYVAPVLERALQDRLGDTVE